MKRLLGHIPWVPPAINLARKQRENALRATMNRGLSWAWGLPERRAALFDILPGPYALAQHSAESYLVPANDSVIGRALYYRGDFDLRKFMAAHAIIVAERALPDGEDLPVLLDIGANIGSICIPAVKRGYAARAIAVEPDEENIRLLTINALLNSVDDRIAIHRAAVGDREGSVVVVRSASNSGDHRVTVALEDASETVPMLTLDTLTSELDFANTVLWMDIQGYEGFALAGANRFLTAGSPMVIEFSKADLEAAGCYDMLIAALEASAYTRFFDVTETCPRERPLSAGTLHDLGRELAARDSFTDLLFLKR